MCSSKGGEISNCGTKISVPTVVQTGPCDVPMVT